MDALNSLFEDIEFSERWRGYDPEEVDAYVERVARAAALVQGRLRELQQRAEAAEARLAGGGGEAEQALKRTLVLAQRTADAAVAEARQQAEVLVAEAREEARRLVSEAENRSQATVAEAEHAAAAMVHDAQEKASRLLAEAETDRRRILADAESEAEAAARAARDRLADEVRRLEELRAFLADDVEILESHLAVQRERLREQVAALSRLVDDPAAFRVEPAPATSGVVVEVAAPAPSGEGTSAGEAVVPVGAGEPTASYDEVGISLDAVMPTAPGPGAVPDGAGDALDDVEPPSWIVDEGSPDGPEESAVAHGDGGERELAEESVVADGDGGAWELAEEAPVDAEVVADAAPGDASSGDEPGASVVVDLTAPEPAPRFVTAADLAGRDADAAGEPGLDGLPPATGFDDDEGSWADVAWRDEADAGTGDGAGGGDGDRYLDQLRDLDEQVFDGDEDPLSLFFAGDDPDDGGSGWLGRRR